MQCNLRIRWFNCTNIYIFILKCLRKQPKSTKQKRFKQGKETSILIWVSRVHKISIYLFDVLHFTRFAFLHFQHFSTFPVYLKSNFRSILWWFLLVSFNLNRIFLSAISQMISSLILNKCESFYIKGKIDIKDQLVWKSLSYQFYLLFSWSTPCLKRFQQWAFTLLHIRCIYIRWSLLKLCKNDYHYIYYAW